MNDNSNAWLKTNFKFLLFDALYRFVGMLMMGALFGMGVAWYHFVGPLSGYFLALITFGLVVLVIGTLIYSTRRMRTRE